MVTRSSPASSSSAFAFRSGVPILRPVFRNDAVAQAGKAEGEDREAIELTGELNDRCAQAGCFFVDEPMAGDGGAGVAGELADFRAHAGLLPESVGGSEGDDAAAEGDLSDLFTIQAGFESEGGAGDETFVGGALLRPPHLGRGAAVSTGAGCSS